MRIKQPSDNSLYVTIGNYVYYFDDSIEGENIVSMWHLDDCAKIVLEKIKPIHSMKCDGIAYYDDEMSEKDLMEKHGIPVQTLLANDIVEPRDYKKTFGRNRYRTIYKYTDQIIEETELCQ